MTTDYRIPQLPGIDARDYGIDFTNTHDSSTALEQLIRDVVQYTVAGQAVGQRVSTPQGVVATTRTLRIPLIDTDVDPTNSYYLGNTRVLDFFGCRIAPNFARGDVVEFFIPQTMVSAVCNPADTTLHVFTTSDFPAYPFNILVANTTPAVEAMTVTGLASPGVWNVTRNALGTTAGTIAPYAAVSLKCSTGFMNVVGLGIDGTNAPATTASATLVGTLPAVSVGTQTSIEVGSIVGTFPNDKRFTITIDAGTASAEKLLVTGGAGTNADPYIVLRGYGATGTTPTHSNGAAIIRVATLVKFNGGTLNGSYLQKVTLDSYRLEHYSGNGVVMEGSCFENLIRAPKAFANLANVTGNALTLQSLGNSAVNVGVSSIDVYGGTLSRGSRLIHAIETDVKVFGGTYLQADKEAIKVSSSRETAIFGGHFEDNFLSGTACTGSFPTDWTATGTDQAAIYISGGGDVNGCSAHGGTYKKQRYLLRVFATSTDEGRTTVVMGGSAFNGQSDRYVRVEGTGAGSVTMIGCPGGDNGVWVDGSGGAVKVTEVNNADIDGIKVDGNAIATAPFANASLATMAAKTVKMRHTNSTGTPEDVSMANLWADLSGQAAVPIDMNSQKLTNLAAGSASGNSARYDQLVDQLAIALGLKNWNMNPAAASTHSGPTSQTIYAMAIWLPPGLTITGVNLSVNTPAAGNKPSGFFVGIASDNAGTRTMRAQSGDLSGNSGVPFATAGGTQCAFSGTYATSAAHAPNGLYYIVILQNGGYGSTQPTFARGAALTPSTGLLAFATGGTGQAALPANTNAITLATTGTPLPFMVGAY